MLYVALGLLFAAVFIFILWRIISMHPTSPRGQETYICPHCGERHCDCHKRGNPPRS
jgi:hypothetical protein